MPYASDAQRRKFHAMEARGEISSKTVHEFDEASKGKKLPEHVHHKKASKTMTEAKKTRPGTEAISENFKHSMHGADGSHQESHKKLGGARGAIELGSPEEQEAHVEKSRS